MLQDGYALQYHVDLRHNKKKVASEQSKDSPWVSIYLDMLQDALALQRRPAGVQQEEQILFQHLQLGRVVLAYNQAMK